MRFFIATLITCCSVLALTAQKTQDPIPYYIADSIRPYMPLAQTHFDSICLFNKNYHENHIRIDRERQIKADEINRDSTKWSALILHLHKLELQELEDSLRAHKLSSDHERHVMDSAFRAEEIKIIHAAALVVIAQKGWKEVYENAQMHNVLMHAPTGVMTYNITELVLQEMKLK